MFLGQFKREVDPKGRFQLPAKLKRALTDLGDKELLLTMGFDKSVYLFPKSRWLAFVAKEIDSRSELSGDTRQLKRSMAANAETVEIDKQGRLLIPKAFASKFGLGKRIVVVGSIDHIEIWAEDAWKSFSDEMQGELDSIAEKIFRTDKAEK